MRSPWRALTPLENSTRIYTQRRAERAGGGQLRGRGAIDFGGLGGAGGRGGDVSSTASSLDRLSRETLPFTVFSTTSRDELPICPRRRCLLSSPSVVTGKSLRIPPFTVLSCTSASRSGGSTAVMLPLTPSRVTSSSDPRESMTASMLPFVALASIGPAARLMLIDPFRVRASIPPVTPASAIDPFMVRASTLTSVGSSTRNDAMPFVDRCLKRLKMSSHEWSESPKDPPPPSQSPRLLESAQT